MLKKLLGLKNKKGFTLIELIVVIAILAILAAILVPSMLNVLSDSKQKVADANARAVYSAAQAAYVSIATSGTAPAGDADGTDYLSSSTTDPFIIEVNKNLGSLTGTYTVTVGTNGIMSVVYANGGVTGNYPA